MEVISLIIDNKGEINIWHLSEEQKKKIGKETNVLNFAKKLFNEKKRVLLIDKNPYPSFSASVLKGTVEGEVIENNLYLTPDGYNIIWQPGIATPWIGYDVIIIINWLMERKASD